MNSLSGIDELPDDIAVAVRNGALADVTIGCSGTRVLRVATSGASPRYLKLASAAHIGELHAEKARLQWLQGRLPVPAVLASGDDGTRACLLLTEVPGLMACDSRLEGRREAVVRALAMGLRMIHDVDVTACPFDERTASKLATARARLETGMVDEDGLSAQASKLGGARLLRWLEEHVSTDEDLVFTHGDYCLPNVLLDPQAIVVRGFVDWGRAGIADRYVDLALAARSLTYNFGDGWESVFWEAYAIEAVDGEKLEYYRLLDELY